MKIVFQKKLYYGLKESSVALEKSDFAELVRNFFVIVKATKMSKQQTV